MAFRVPYDSKTVTVPDDLIPGNSTDEQPVQFDIVPAWGPDLVRIRSMIVATVGLNEMSGWTAQITAQVLQSMAHAFPLYQNTVKAIRGLKVPYAMALRAGFVEEKDKKAVGQDFAVTSGFEFSRICGDQHLMQIAYFVAMEIGAISKAAEIDPRFSQPPSGSPGTGTSAPSSGTAASAPLPPSGNGTADNGGKTGT